MKNLIKIPYFKERVAVLALCTMWMFGFSESVLHAQGDGNVLWDYPVKPGMEEWKTTSYTEKVERSQPPKELLKNWDTKTLFRYCVDYPFNAVTLLFNNPNDGFRRAYEQSSVWQEFIQRKDALDNFVKYFETHPYKQLLEMRDVENNNNVLFTLFFLEKLVSETDFTVLLDTSDKKKLATVILNSHQSKKQFPDEFIGFHYNSSLSALLKILENDQVVSANDEISLEKFREVTGREYFIDEGMDSAIINKVFNYINK